METENDKTNDSSPVYCEYTFIVPLPNITGLTLQKENGFQN